MSGRWLAPLLAATVMGCTPAPAASGAPLDVPGARVMVPAGWSAELTDPGEWPAGRTIALLANRALAPACETSGGVRRCTAPASSLDDGELVVWWLSTTCAGTDCEPSDGRPLLVGGREAAEVSEIHACDPLATTRQRAFVVAVSPQRVDALVVCERNPVPATLEELDALLETVDWRTP